MTEESGLRGSRAGCAIGSCQRRINLATLLLVLSWGVGGGMSMPRGVAPPAPYQDPASLPLLDEVAIAEIREHLANAEPQEREQRIATLYQLIKQYVAEAGASGDPRLAIPPPLLHNAVRVNPGLPLSDAVVLAAGADEGGADDDAAEEESKPKRMSSYMILCHFKLCNLGRKRNYRYNQSIRA